MQSKAKTIAEYLDELAPDERAQVKELDALVRRILPEATAGMKYGMPTYDYEGRMVALNAQKNYFSFYADPELVEKHRAELGKLSVGKSCIRFGGKTPAPLAVLEKILRSYRR